MRWRARLWLLAAIAPALTFACAQAWDQYDSRLPCADPTNCGAPNCDGTLKPHCALWSDRWGDTMHSLDPSSGHGVAVGDGGVAMLGCAQGTFDLGLGAPAVLDDPSLLLVWVAADTGKPVWAVTSQIDGGGVYPTSVAIGPGGEVYVLGHATDAFTLAPWGLDGDAGVLEGGTFVARVSPSGVPERVVRLGAGTAKEVQDPPSALAVAPSGIYAISGADVWALDGGLAGDKVLYAARSAFHAAAPDEGGLFVGGVEHPDGGPEAGVGGVRFVPEGDAGPAAPPVLTLDTAASSAASASKVQALARGICGAQRYLFVAGQFTDQVTFPGQPPITPPVPGVAEVFLARCAPDLSGCDWVRHAAAAVTDGGQSYQSLYGPTALALDGQGGLLLGFSFRGRLDFDQGGTVAVLGGTADLDMAVVKFSCDGQLQWARRFGQDSSCISCMSPNAVPNLLGSLAVGPGGIYLAGTANTSIDFGSGVLAPVGLTDLVLVELAP